MKTLLLFAFSLLLYPCFAQEAYVFSTFTDPYTEFSDGTNIELEEDWDDPEYALPLGFNFTSLDVTSNQLISDGLGGTFALYNTDQSAGAIFGLFDDIADGANVNGAEASTIAYKIDGVEGSQICKIQLTNCAFYGEVFQNEPSAQNRMDYQIWVYEGSNAVEIRFGPSNIPSPQVAFEGNNGPIVAFAAGAVIEDDIFEYGAILEGNSQNPDLAEIDFNTFPSGLDNMPESGRVYRFEPNVVSTTQLNVPSFKIYPTIAQDDLRIEGEFTGWEQYRIFDITGKCVDSGMLSGTGVINVNALTKGVYLLSLDGFSGTQKFIKQ